MTTTGPTDWEERLEKLDDDNSSEEKLNALLGKIRSRSRPAERETKYTVVVQLSSTVPSRAFVLETGRLSKLTVDEIQDAATKGGVEVLILPADATGVENLKWALMGRDP